MLPKLDGYLTDKGKINLERTELIFKNLALIEDEFFKTILFETLSRSILSVMNKKKI